MRIIHSLEGHAWSGGQQQALFLAHGQAQMGHDVLLMCQQGSELERHAREQGLQIQAHDYRKEVHPLSLVGLARAYEAFKPDVVNVHRAWSHTQWLLVSLQKRFKGLIVTRRVLFRPDRNPVSLVKYRSRAVRGYIAVSEAVRDRLIELRIDANRIKVVYSATDMNRFDPDRSQPLAAPLPFAESTPYALLIGNFHRNKGHLLILEAFARVAAQWPELHLVFAGNGTDGTEIASRIGDLGLRGRVHGLGFRADVPGLIGRARFTVNASYEEGFAGSIRESLAMGVPVIVSDIPANREVASRVPLHFFESGNTESLARALLSQREQKPDLLNGRKLRQRVQEEFSVSSMVQKTLAAYRELGVTTP